MMEALAIGVHRAIPGAVVAAGQTAAGTMAAEATLEVGTAEKTTAEERTAMAESEAVADSCPLAAGLLRQNERRNQCKLHRPILHLPTLGAGSSRLRPGRLR